VNLQSLLYIILFIGAGQGLLLSTALFFMKRGNTAANRILAILLFSFSVLISAHAFGHSHAHPPNNGRNHWLIHSFLFVIAPLIFFYTKALTEYNFKIHTKNMVHLLPSIGAILVIFLLTKVFQFQEYSTFTDRIILLLLALQMLLYLVRMIFILRNHARKLRNTYSSLEKINHRWLNFFVMSQVIIWPIAFVIETHKHDSSEVGIVWLLVSIFMYMTGYFGIRQPEIFSGELIEESMPAQNGKKKYEKSTLSTEQAEAILQRLQAFMQSSKPYITPTLTLTALSKQLNVSSHHLSQVINEQLNKNFFEYINQFRVREAQRLLKDPKNRHLTLAAIGFEAGFNSVSSFNSIFKKITSSTPSQFQLSSEPATENFQS
jgi:AraC-like DNA-binding protein